MARWLAFLNCKRGTTAVEFAAVIGPLLVLMFAVAEYGQAFWTQEGLQEAAIAGARCVGMLSVNCTSGGTYSATTATAFIQAEAQKWSITLPSSGISVNTSTTCGGVAGFSQVSLTYTYQPILPVLLDLLPTGTTLTATSCFPTA
jgi:Flp pilus assembly protein TadG